MAREVGRGGENDRLMSGSMMESRKIRGIVRKTERMAKEIESGEIVEELKELRKVMEEMVSVLRKVVSGLERREDVE